MTAPVISNKLSWFLAAPPGDELDIYDEWPTATMAEWAWDGATGAGARICVIDSGIDRDHPLVGEVAASYTVTPDLSVIPDELPDQSGHGTACASIIRRIAPDCSITSMRVLGNLFGSGEVLVAGLRWAVVEGFDVVSMSLSTSKVAYTQALRELADEAFFGRVVLVSSAHNSRIESYPWRFSSVLSVGSHPEPDSNRIFYNPKPPVEFYAPGVNIPVAWANGTEMRVTGNSFATPYVAGMCALLLSKHPGLTPFQVKTALYLTAANIRRDHS